MAIARHTRGYTSWHRAFRQVGREFGIDRFSCRMLLALHEAGGEAPSVTLHCLLGDPSGAGTRRAARQLAALDHITIKPGKAGGTPTHTRYRLTARGKRIAVNVVLDASAGCGDCGDG